VLVAALAAAVVLGLGLYADFGALGDALGRFRWELFPLALALTTLNYVVRFGRWEVYVHRLGIEVPNGRSLSIYLAGQTMTISPGKVGEVLKSALLRRSFDTPVARSAPIVLAERVTDALGVVILAAIAALLARSSANWQVALAGLVLVVVVVAAVRVPWLARVTRLADARATALELLGPRLVVGMSLVSAASWFCECLAAYVCTRGLGLHVSLAAVTLVFALGSLAGALSFLPGGLGVAETSMTALFLALSPIPRADAAAAVVLIRLATLWFAVALGLTALAVETRLARSYASAEPEPERRSSIR
jgi:uncharacterized membrane protein YbhN (UPF0104 family)